MKKGFIYRLIYGKGKEKDFTLQNLPATRTKQFFFVFKNYFGKIFRVNLLAGLFVIPYLVWDFILTGYVARFMRGLPAEEQFSHLLRLSLLQYGTEIPMIMLAFLGLAGGFYIIRRLFWGAPVMILKDFGKGIRQSWKQYLALGFITGLFNFGASYFINFNLLTVSKEVEFIHVLAIFGIVLLTLICFVALVFALAQSSLYGMTFFGLVKNSFILTFKRLFRGLGIFLLSVLPVLAFRFMPWAFMQIIGGCLTLIIGIGFALCVQSAFCLKVFDEFINAKSYPKFVNLGLNSGVSFFEALNEEPAEEQDDEN